MNSISVNQEKSKRTGVKFSFKSMIMLMAAIMIAFATLTSCDEDDKNDDDPDEIENGSNSPIVGMWRSKRYYSASSGTVGVVFFNADATYQVIRYRHDRFIGEKGKYRLNGNTLEVYDLSWFSKHDDALSFDYFVTDLTKIRDLISSGTKNELLEIINPQHSIWKNYVGITGTGGWHEMDSWTETIEWIDNNTIDYQNELYYPLERVK